MLQVFNNNFKIQDMYLQYIIYTMKKRQFIIVIYFLIVFTFGCKKFIEVDPPTTKVTEENIFNNAAYSISAMTSIYTDIANYNNSVDKKMINSIFFYTGLSADELVPYLGNSSSNTYLKYYVNRLAGKLNDDEGSQIWSWGYNNIFIVNSILEGVSNSSQLSQPIKDQLLGEAKFMRAFFYFYLVNLYGPLPLATTTDYKMNSSLERMPVERVYQQIIQDLHESQLLLSSTYLDGSLLKPTPDRLRPTKWAATALLARAYLYAGNWSGADSAASVLIDNNQFSLPDLQNVFLNSSNEAIWQLQNVQKWGGTVIAETLIPQISNNQISVPASISNQLLSSFESNDLRLQKWIDSVTTSDGQTYHYTSKYKARSDGGTDLPQIERWIVFRLAEQYLIRANARLKLNNLSGAKSDLDQIRHRAGLLGTTANDDQSLLKAIIHERQVELFTEWGDRWFELKRTKQIDDVMKIVCPQKGTTWDTNWQLYPLPYKDLIANKKLTQNTDY